MLCGRIWYRAPFPCVSLGYGALGKNALNTEQRMRHLIADFDLATLDRTRASISDSSIPPASISYAFLRAIAYQFTVKVKVCEWLTPFEVPVIVKV
jgi:hypothetical protein